MPTHRGTVVLNGGCIGCRLPVMPCEGLMTLFDFNYGLCFLVTSTLINQSLAKKLPVIGAAYFVHRRTVRFGPKIARSAARCARMAGCGRGAGHRAGHHLGGVSGHRGSAALVVQARGALGRPRRSVQSGGCVVVDARQLLRKLDDAECAAISGLAFLAVFALGGH